MPRPEMTAGFRLEECATPFLNSFSFFFYGGWEGVGAFSTSLELFVFLNLTRAHFGLCVRAKL